MRWIISVGLLLWTLPVVYPQESLQPWLQALESPDAQTRSNAATVLGTMGKAAAPAVPALIKALDHQALNKDDRDCQRNVIIALGQVGDAALPAVPTMLKAAAVEIPDMLHTIATIKGVRGGAPYSEARISNLLNRLVIQIIVQLGEQAMPALRQSLAVDDESIRWLVLDAFEQIKPPQPEVAAIFIEALSNKSLMVRCKAAIALGELGEPAAIAIPNLVAAYYDKKNYDSGPWSGDRYYLNGCYHAAVALGKIGRCGELHQKILPIFLEELTRQRPFFMDYTIIGIGHLREKGANAVPHLIPLLTHAEQDYRFYAIKALGMIGEPAAPAIPALMKILADHDNIVNPSINAKRFRPGVRRSFIAAEALANMGEKALLALKQALRSADPCLQAGAAIALQMIADKTSQEMLTLEDLTGLFYQDNPTIQGIAVGLLARRGDEAIPLLVKALDYECCDPASYELLKRGKTAVPYLLQTFANNDDHLRYFHSSKEIIVEMGDVAVPYLIAALADPKPEVRARVAFTLGLMGNKATPAVSRLIELLSGQERDVCHYATFALGRIGPPAAAAAPYLIRQATADNANLRKDAVWALGGIGPEAVLALPCLIKALEDSDDSVRVSAAWALGQWGKAAQSAIPMLLLRLLDEHDSVKTQATSALRQFGPDSLPHLEKLLADDKFATAHFLIREFIVEIKQAEAKKAETPQPDHK